MLMVCGALRGSRHQPQHFNIIPVSQQNYVGPTNITFNCAFAALQPPPRGDSVCSSSPPHCQT